MSEAHRSHRASQAGPKAERKRKKEQLRSGAIPKGSNFKAFGFKSAVRARLNRIYVSEKMQKKEHNVVMNRTGDEPPPIMVAVVGPKGVGKSTLIRSLVKHYVKTNVSDCTGPISIVTGKNRYVLFLIPTSCNPGNEFVMLL